DEIEAVLAPGVTRLDQLLPRLKALKAFRRLPEAEALAAANKRIRNILKQAGGKPRDQVDASLLREDAERVLAEQVNARRAEVEPLFVKGDFEAALRSLASLRGPVDTFFDKVMVMVEDESLKQNRLALLNSLSNLFLGAADISRLQGRQP
ncbi:MAG: DALR anticodon-binding domain-containing protein, partial [Pseudomonadota bacterium]